jgi:hypothetical protein
MAAQQVPRVALPALHVDRNPEHDRTAGVEVSRLAGLFAINLEPSWRKVCAIASAISAVDPSFDAYATRTRIHMTIPLRDPDVISDPPHLDVATYRHAL